MASGVTRFKALPPWAKHVRWLAVILTTSPWIVFNLFRFLPPWAMLLLVLLYAVIGLQVLLPQRIEVGADGVMLRSLGMRRFVRFDRVRHVAATSLGVRLGLDGGKDVEIRLTQRANAASADVDRLLSAIEQGRDAFGRLARAEEESLLARGARDLDAWVEEMRALGAGARGGYRALSIPTDRLWDVVANASADPSAREGAAVALHGTLDEDGRARLREVAATTASPRLRVALEAVADVREAERVRAALGELEDLEEVEEQEEPRAGTLRGG